MQKQRKPQMFWSDQLTSLTAHMVWRMIFFLRPYGIYFCGSQKWITLLNQKTLNAALEKTEKKKEHNIFCLLRVWNSAFEKLGRKS